MGIKIRRLEISDEASLRQAQTDLAQDDFTFAFDLDSGPDFDFAGYVERLRHQESGRDLADSWVPTTFLVAVDREEVVGRVSIRHELNDFLAAWGGHVGYGVKRSHRRRGIASLLLAAGLDRLREVGVDRALVTCDLDNVGSATVIERAGGAFESIVDDDPDGGPPKRRYWIDLTTDR